MVHLVYCDNKTNELSKILDGSKTMIIRGATGRKVPHSRVFVEETLYFTEKGSKKITAKADVKNVENFVKLSKEDMINTIEINNDKLLLSDKEKEKWQKRCLCLIEFENVEMIEPLEFSHNSIIDDWLILENIEDVTLANCK